ncbi:hypothetical protein [Anaerovibrio slackiae]|uniref:hypothetical protein n=1 Tax=Anaerovibrio slackiae TaxID=2652309 RepID=UPI003F171203
MGGFQVILVIKVNNLLSAAYMLLVLHRGENAADGIELEEVFFRAMLLGEIQYGNFGLY